MKPIFHPWTLWECYPAGFYATVPDGMTPTEACAAYARFLRNDDAFRAALDRVLIEWPHSCERFLNDEGINRVAWLGQAAACISRGLSSKFRSGFHLLSECEREQANATAQEYLDLWIVRSEAQTR